MPHGRPGPGQAQCSQHGEDTYSSRSWGSRGVGQLEVSHAETQHGPKCGQAERPRAERWMGSAGTCASLGNVGEVAETVVCQT